MRTCTSRPAGRWAGAGLVHRPIRRCVPEFFGDTILVNGTVYPFLEVEQRQYRFRMLNACNARFLNPRLVYAQGSTFPGDTEPKANAAGPAFIQIGTEGGIPAGPGDAERPEATLAAHWRRRNGRI